MAKQNCWEYKKCGKQGVCPAYIEVRLDGVHGGQNAGRSCWVVAETHCDGKVQAGFASKFSECAKCEFYIKVKHEEEVNFMLSPLLLRKLKEDTKK